MTLWDPSTPIFESFWNESSCPANLGLAEASGPERGGGGARASKTGGKYGRLSGEPRSKADGKQVSTSQTRLSPEKGRGTEQETSTHRAPLQRFFARDDRSDTSLAGCTRARLGWLMRAPLHQATLRFTRTGAGQGGTPDHDCSPHLHCKN